MSAQTEFHIHPNADSYSFRGAQAMWKEIDRLRAELASNTYEDQTFEEARKLMKGLLNSGHTVAQMYLTMKACGVLRNDAEVKAFDTWEQSQ